MEEVRASELARIGNRPLWRDNSEKVCVAFGSILDDVHGSRNCRTAEMQPPCGAGKASIRDERGIVSLRICGCRFGSQTTRLHQTLADLLWESDFDLKIESQGEELCLLVLRLHSDKAISMRVNVVRSWSCGRSSTYCMCTALPDGIYDRIFAGNEFLSLELNFERIQASVLRGTTISKIYPCRLQGHIQSLVRGP